MSFYRIFNSILLVASLGLISGCLEQYDPAPANKLFQTEYNQSKNVPANLSASGELPVAGAVVTIDVKFANFCASCHGATGGGDGPAGAALTPKPRNFHDAQWQAATSDEQIYNVIKNGGAAAGLAPIMAPWGGVLSDAEIKEMVTLVRGFKK